MIMPDDSFFEVLDDFDNSDLSCFIVKNRLYKLVLFGSIPFNMN
jgi:hypothetical protein